MAVHYADTLKQARMQEVIDAVDDHATIEGYIEIGTGPATATSIGTSLVSIDLEDPSFAAPTTAGVINMHITAPKTGLDGIATGTGTAAVARICDGADAVVVWGLVVGTAIGPGVEIALSALAISSGQTVTLTAGTITHAT
ncbi:MAG: hypothetical protein C5B60_07400 [Chloroflexi bacterium]|nr:MAG: hypothetical protein C5B60_07400 [Chloroflexota bacterium]